MGLKSISHTVSSGYAEIKIRPIMGLKFKHLA